MLLKLTRCLDVDYFTECIFSFSHVNWSPGGKKETACGMPSLPLPFRVLLLSHDTAMAVQQLPKLCPAASCLCFTLIFPIGELK